MLTHSTAPRAPRPLVPSEALLIAALVASSCDKVPLLAPTGTVITLFPGASTVPVDGNVEIIAT